MHQDVESSKTFFNKVPIRVMIQMQDFPIPVMRDVVLDRVEVWLVFLHKTFLVKQLVNGRQVDSAQVTCNNLSKLFIINRVAERIREIMHLVMSAHPSNLC